MDISQRTKNLGTEQAFVVLAEVEKLKSQGRDIISFCIGQPDFVTPDNIREAGIKAIKDGKTGYTASAGIPELRQAVAKYLSKTRNIKISANEVVIANGQKPFIMYAIASVTDFGKGHEVLYPVPGYPIYESQIIAQGAMPRPLPLLEKNEFKFDIKTLAKGINKNTRLLILNTPQNPTGSVLTKNDLIAISKILKKYKDVWVFSDEIYSRIIYPVRNRISNGVYDKKFISIASLPGMRERTIIADGVSKIYAMTGWRIGFAANKILAPSFERWMTNITACANHIAQYAALEALSGSQKEPEKMVRIFKERRDLIVSGLNSIRGIKCLKPDGTFYVWPNVTKACKISGTKNAEDFRKKLLIEAGVAVLADIHFGPRIKGEGQHIRLSFATSTENIKEGLKRIKNYIDKYVSLDFSEIKNLHIKQLEIVKKL